MDQDEIQPQVDAPAGPADFDAVRHLTQVSGNDYLETKWRLVWLRTKSPNAVIETEMMHHEDKFAIFKARVSLPDTVNPNDGVILQRGGSATGWGSETQGDFRDYIEKAETKALGRALAALGFGTQFAEDANDGGSRDRPVDSPVNRGSRAQQQDGPRGNPNVSISPKQVGFAANLAHELGMNDQQIDADVTTLYQKAKLPDLNGLEGSQYIALLQQRKADGWRFGQTGGEQGAANETPAVAPPTKKLESGLSSWDEVAAMANLGEPDAVQRESWSSDCAIAFSGDPESEDVKRDLRMLFGLAMDVTKADAQQGWRFQAAVPFAKTITQINAIGTLAGKCGANTQTLIDVLHEHKLKIAKSAPRA